MCDGSKLVALRDHPIGLAQPRPTRIRSKKPERALGGSVQLASRQATLAIRYLQKQAEPPKISNLTGRLS